MSFSNETQQKINQFAKEQSQLYLEEAEMTYLEKLRRNTNKTKNKIGAKLARFKGSSAQGIDAQNDMILYMSDYMNDLMSKGMTEQDAFKKAKEELAAPGVSDIRTDIRERYCQYYENRDPRDYEAIGLLHGGFTIIGLAIGAVIGYSVGGGWHTFLDGGWVDTVIGSIAGVMIGEGIALICNAIIEMIKRK